MPAFQCVNRNMIVNNIDSKPLFLFHSNYWIRKGKVFSFKVHFVVQKKQRYLSQIHVFFDKISLTKIKTRKSFKKGSEKSQICQGKPTNTWQIKFLMDWSLNLSQIIKPFPPSNLRQIFIWDVFFVRRNAPLRPHQVKYSKTKIPFKSAKGKFTCDFFVLFWLSGE